MGKDHSARAGGLHGGEDVQEEGEVAILLGRHPQIEATEPALCRQARAPRLRREGRIGDHEVEGLDLGIGRLELRLRDDVALRDLGILAAMHDHVHLGETASRDVELLTIDRERDVSGIGGLQEQGSRSARWVVDGLPGAGGAVNACHSGNDSRNFGRRIELTLALAGLRREVPHQVFIGVAEDVVPIGAIPAEVQLFTAEDVDESRQRRHHLWAAAEFLGVVEVGAVDDVLEVVRLRDTGDRGVDPLADVLGAAQLLQVVERATQGHIDQRVVLAGAVGHVFHEEEREDVVLVKGCIHAATELVAAVPKGAVDVAFFDCHSCPEVMLPLFGSI